MIDHMFTEVARYTRKAEPSKTYRCGCTTEKLCDEHALRVPALRHPPLRSLSEVQAEKDNEMLSQTLTCEGCREATITFEFPEAEDGESELDFAMSEAGWEYRRDSRYCARCLPSVRVTVL